MSKVCLFLFSQRILFGKTAKFLLGLWVVLFLSDIVPTSFHATELANVKEGDTVAIWGAGPIGGF